ncbi:MAG: hypothetical protein MR878_00270 [Campylobacter sp.]|uniref:hypothetical protein n=1 Tax=Campylobacter sp. TaxID=205 RepID=UPI002AA700D3|nr:hypothetical protein [Campylobacter sp.]MCI7013809.1 hypothetical protein [Campylobacter sp.]
MQGKILSPQLISGDDGKRYEYDKNDVINLDCKDLAVLTGSQVEFLSFDKRVAKSIYIIAENVNVSSILSADSISFARLSALLGLGLLIFISLFYILGSFFISTLSFEQIIDIKRHFFNFILYARPIIAIVSFVLYSMAIYSVSKAAASKSLFKNYIIAVIISFLGIFLFFMLAPSGASSASDPIAFVSLCSMIALIAAIYFYKIHAELARLSGSSLFLWAFWIFVVIVPLYFLFIMSLRLLSFFIPGFAFFITLAGFAGFITFAVFAVPIIVLVPLFVAWWRFGKVEKR